MPPQNGTGSRSVRLDVSFCAYTLVRPCLDLFTSWGLCAQIVGVHTYVCEYVWVRVGYICLLVRVRTDTYTIRVSRVYICVCTVVRVDLLECVRVHTYTYVLVCVHT